MDALSGNTIALDVKVERSTRPKGSPMRTCELALLVVDIVSSTELLCHLGDVGYADVLEAFKDQANDALSRHHGAEIADTGDGFIYAFADARLAVAAAESIRRQVADQDEPGLRVRCGIHRGSLVVCRYGAVGLTLYEAVELGNAAHADEIWLSPAAAVGTRYQAVPAQTVALPRSGETPVVVLPPSC